jgi:cytochrome P450
MTDVASLDDGLRPPAPMPRTEPLGLAALFRTLWHNPIEAWSRKHFDEPVVLENFGFGRVYVVSEPGAIQHVLLDNAANYRKDPLQVRVLSTGLKGGLLTVEGQKWRAQRRTLAPMFAMKTVNSLAPPMMRAAETLVGRWRALETGSVVELNNETTLLTFDMLERTIFSDALGDDPEALRTAMTQYFDTIGRIDPFDVLGLPSFIPRLAHWRARRLLKYFNKAIDAMVARRRQQGSSSSDTPDLLTLLIEARDPQTNEPMAQDELRANILTFIAAGQETTANLITWSLFLLSQSDEWQERVAAEAEREADTPTPKLAAQLVETTAVINEALRLYPPITAISRSAIGADEFAGQQIKRGSMVVISPYVLHRHRLLWERPDVFDPTRFLGPARESIGRFNYLPFGIGPHTCIGGYFSMQQAALAVASIAKNFRLTVAPGHKVWPLQRITLRPAGGLPMVVTRRA